MAISTLMPVQSLKLFDLGRENSFASPFHIAFFTLQTLTRSKWAASADFVALFCRDTHRTEHHNQTLENRTNRICLQSHVQIIRSVWLGISILPSFVNNVGFWRLSSGAWMQHMISL